MNEIRTSRRSFLMFSSTFAAATGMLLAGCDGASEKKLEEVRTTDPQVLAKDSMDFYKNSTKKGGSPKK